jgi:integrase
VRYTNSLPAWEGIFVAKSKLRLVSPTNENRTVTPRRRPNAELRSWDQLDFNRAVLHVRRVKQGTPATHPLTGLEMRALRKLQRKSETSPFVFVSERGAPFSTAGFARLLGRAAETAGLEIKAHPHMLRHACGFKLANDGVDTRALQAYLGHKSIQHTVRYTELAPTRFKGFWRDLLI